MEQVFVHSAFIILKKVINQMLGSMVILVVLVSFFK